MDGANINFISIAVGAFGIATGVAGVVLNFLNRDRYRAQSDIYKPENEELRAINSRKTSDITELIKQNEVLKAEAEKMKDSIKDLKELNGEKLITLMSNNHKEVMIKLTDIARKAMK